MMVTLLSILGQRPNLCSWLVLLSLSMLSPIYQMNKSPAAAAEVTPLYTKPVGFLQLLGR